MTDASATTTAAATAIANPGGDIEVDPNLVGVPRPVRQGYRVTVVRTP